MTDHHGVEISERLASSETGIQPWLWLPLLKLLALGDPVDVADLAAATGRPIEEVRQALDGVPDTEYDESGRIIGQGLTQRATQHRFETGGEQLYTWCALDTLIFPTLLGGAAQIESADHATGTPVRISIEARGITSAEPATAVVSLVNPEDMGFIRSAFCNQVHFFASTDTAAPWLESHPGAVVLPVAQAYALAATMAETLTGQAGDRHRGGPGNGVQACSC